MNNIVYYKANNWQLSRFSLSRFILQPCYAPLVPILIKNVKLHILIHIVLLALLEFPWRRIEQLCSLKLLYRRMTELPPFLYTFIDICHIHTGFGRRIYICDNSLQSDPSHVAWRPQLWDQQKLLCKIIAIFLKM